MCTSAATDREDSYGIDREDSYGIDREDSYGIDGETDRHTTDKTTDTAYQGHKQTSTKGI